MLDINLKRSKSNKELQSKSSTKLSATSSIIPLINQCIHPERTTTTTTTTVTPPRRPPPPIPKKQSILVDNHIYDSFQDSPIMPNSKQRRMYTQPKPIKDICRTVPKKDHLPPMKVTEL